MLSKGSTSTLHHQPKDYFPFAHGRLWTSIAVGALWKLIFSRLWSVYWIPEGI